MIEYEGQDGGRYTYIDDIVNLQSLALAFGSIFTGCDNFIISGCNISGNKISEGYVYINGKIRHFEGATSVTFPYYIYESNKIQNVTYANTNSKVGRKIYSCASGQSIPTATDPITKVVPQAITVTAASAARFNDAFFGKYALMINSPRALQTVENKVLFNGQITFASGLISQNELNITNSLGAFKASYDSNGNLVLQSTSAGKATNKFIISNSGSFEFYNGSVLCASISSSSINLNGHTLIGARIQGGNIAMASSDIVNIGVSADTGGIDVNKSGYNGGTAYYRNFNVYNGKGVALLQITGSSSQAIYNGNFKIANSNISGVVLKNTAYNKTAVEFQKLIYWQDKAEENVAYCGYDLATDSVFRIKNTIGDIEICPSSCLNVTGSIKEGGTLLSEKYLTINTANTELSKKANASSVYSKTDSDGRYVPFGDGLTPILDYLTGKDDKQDAKLTLRTQIGALSKSDTDKLYISKSGYLSDIATNDAQKRQICSNIGAAYATETQGKLKDSGWRLLQSPGLYIRQIGNTVTIQGTLNVTDVGLIGNIPNEIDAPTYSCGLVANTDMDNDHKNDRGMFVEIGAGSRDFKCTRNTVNAESLPFILTYMV